MAILAQLTGVLAEMSLAAARKGIPESKGLVRRLVKLGQPQVEIYWY